MNGAETLLATLEHNGVEVCFANPGTSEMHFVAALETSTRIRGVLGLFEGVVTGAADGYARMSGNPAVTLLHLGPGLANGLSNLHNALRAGSPIVNVIGDHASYHRDLDAPLTSDIEGTARPFSHWVRTTSGEESLGVDAAEAVTIARRGKIASLILPADAAWNPVGSSAPLATAQAAADGVAQTAAAEAAARVLREGGPRTALLFGGRTATAEALALAAGIAAATGAEVLTNTHLGRIPRGAGRHAAKKVPYPIKDSLPLFERFDSIVLIGAKPPVAFFAYPDRPSRLTPPGTRFVELSGPGRDADALPSLQALYEALGATPAPATELALPQRPTGSITPEKLGAFLGHGIPEDAIVVDESLTTGWRFYPETVGSRPHDWLAGTGGSIGYAMPVAAGAAIASPGRKVITLESDGSGMYMPQALWTQAREGLDVVTLILANRKYQILRNEMSNVGVPEVGPKAGALLDLDRPEIDWVAIARGMGVQASRAETMDELGTAFDAAVAGEGPALIEVVL